MAPVGPGTARDRISARIAITTAAALSPIPIRPPEGGIPIGMGGAGIGIVRQHVGHHLHGGIGGGLEG